MGGFGVWGLGFGVWGLGFGVWGLGFGVPDHLGPPKWSGLWGRGSIENDLRFAGKGSAQPSARVATLEVGGQDDRNEF